MATLMDKTHAHYMRTAVKLSEIRIKLDLYLLFDCGRFIMTCNQRLLLVLALVLSACFLGHSKLYRISVRRACYMCCIARDCAQWSGNHRDHVAAYPPDR
jgi:hypothetical protein